VWSLGLFSLSNSGQVKDRVLVSSNMDVDVVVLYLLMETAFPGLKEEAEVPARVSAEISKSRLSTVITFHHYY